VKKRTVQVLVNEENRHQHKRSEAKEAYARKIQNIKRIDIESGRDQEERDKRIN